MESYLISDLYDLVTPDGFASSIKKTELGSFLITLVIEDISPGFVGFQIEKECICFNLKSSLAQVGVEAKLKECVFDKTKRRADLLIEAFGITPLASKLLGLLSEGVFLGKLFAADSRRLVQETCYLSRLFGRTDRHGDPLLSFGSMNGMDTLSFKKEGRVIVNLPLLNLSASYNEAELEGIFPLIKKSLLKPNLHIRPIIQLLQSWEVHREEGIKPGSLLLAKTLPLHVRTVFAKVVDSELPKGYFHTKANLLEPTTKASGDVYEFYGDTKESIKTVPLEFYTLEPHREHLAFADRSELKIRLTEEESLQKAFDIAPLPLEDKVATFIVKGSQFKTLSEKDWVCRKQKEMPKPLFGEKENEFHFLENYIAEQPEYPFLKSLTEELITSEGVFLSRYLPSTTLKQLLLGSACAPFVKAIYFQYASIEHGEFFSHEDRAFFFDLEKFGIDLFWLDPKTHKLLQYTGKPGKDSGMFIPIKSREDFKVGTSFGIYGSNLIEENFEDFLKELMEGVLAMRTQMNHPLLNAKTPLVFVTGGGPGAMKTGNKVAKELGILSCANVVDFKKRSSRGFVNEQRQNSFIDGKMTYRIDQLVERQAEFHLDFPIFAMGGFGTDFEQALEEVRRKVGGTKATPILLFGKKEYWQEKITSRFQCNKRTGTIADSLWVSNCFYHVETAQEGLKVYRDYLTGKLEIGKEGPEYPDGFKTARD